MQRRRQPVPSQPQAAVKEVDLTAEVLNLWPCLSEPQDAWSATAPDAVKPHKCRYTVVADQKEADALAGQARLPFYALSNLQVRLQMHSQVEDLSGKLASTQGAQKETTKRAPRHDMREPLDAPGKVATRCRPCQVMERISAARDRSLLGQCVQCGELGGGIC